MKHRTRQAALLVLLVLPGLVVAAVCGYYLLRDWSAVIAAFGRLERATRGGDLREIVIAQGYDSVYRLNCLADGVGVLLGVILFGIGVHGLCTLPTTRGE